MNKKNPIQKYLDSQIIGNYNKKSSYYTRRYIAKQPMTYTKLTLFLVTNIPYCVQRKRTRSLFQTSQKRMIQSQKCFQIRGNSEQISPF